MNDPTPNTLHPTDHSKYVGQELETFREAKHWKAYAASQLRRWISGDVLEVGAGLGGSSSVLCSGQETSWTSLEPDPALLAILEQTLSTLANANPGLRARAIAGTLAVLPEEPLFDTILYIDVLEHIEQDRAELRAASKRLRRSGRLIVLSPAHRWLFSEFDRAVGHFRRYDKAQLRALTPEGMRLVDLRYLDSIGMAASLANRIFIRTPSPSARAVQLWDRVMVPLSRRVDPWLRHRFGKTIIAVWERS